MIWPFLTITIPLVLIPGAATTVVLRNSIAGGTRAGLVTAVGLNLANIGYGMLTAFGFALALQRWPSAWAVVRVAGLAYLVWLGIQSLRHALVRREPWAIAPEEAGASHKNLIEGFVTNALNPPIATFYFVVLPQFIPRGAPPVKSALILTAVHVGLAVLWHIIWAVAGGTLAKTLAGGRPRQVLEAIAGVALIGIAIRMAFQ
jgi:threonine/homoserine/homoserine lactone efflux protein